MTSSNDSAIVVCLGYPAMGGLAYLERLRAVDPRIEALTLPDHRALAVDLLSSYSSRSLILRMVVFPPTRSEHSPFKLRPYLHRKTEIRGRLRTLATLFDV